MKRILMTPPRLKKQLDRLLAGLLALAMLVTPLPAAAASPDAAGAPAALAGETLPEAPAPDVDEIAAVPTATPAPTPAGEPTPTPAPTDDTAEPTPQPTAPATPESAAPAATAAPTATPASADAEAVPDEADALADPTAAVAAAANEDDFVVNGSGELTEYTGPGGVVELPEKVKKIINNNALTSNSAITGLVFPAGLQSIADHGLNDFTSLKTVDFSKCTSLTSIGVSAFNGDIALQSVTLPACVQTIGRSAFQGCSKLTALVLTEGLKTIGESAFLDTPIAGELTIPASVTNIDGHAFAGTKLKKVVFAAGAAPVFATESYAFAECTDLQEVVLPKTATAGSQPYSLPNYIFSGCTALKTVSFAADNELQSIGSHAFYNCKALESAVLPDSVITLNSSAFENCSGLTKVDLNKVKTIGGEAFKGAKIPGTLNIPKTVAEIGANAFKDVTGLTKVVFSREADAAVPVLSDESFAFQNCKSLEEVVLPYSMSTKKGSANTLPQYMFEGCTALVKVDFGGDDSKLKTIAAYAFQNCSKLLSVELPKSMRTIEGSAFGGCTGLREVKLNQGLEKIAGSAFYNAGMGYSGHPGTLIMPNTLQTIGEKAFAHCKYLKDVVFPQDADAVEVAFDHNYGSYHTFESCTNLTTVILPAKFTAVDNKFQLPSDIFSGCTNLRAVYIPASANDLDMDTFNAIKTKMTIYGEKDSYAQKYASINGIKFVAGMPKGYNVDSITLEPSTITVSGTTVPTETYQLTATVLPETALDRTVTYSASPEGVVDITDDGQVSFKKFGTTTITATTRDGQKTATCAVTVLQEFTAAEKQALAGKFLAETDNKKTVAVNVYPTVGALGIKTPSDAGCTVVGWTEPDAEILADGQPHLYDITVRKQNYVDTVIEDAVQITGVAVEGIQLKKGGDPVGDTDRLVMNIPADYTAELVTVPTGNGSLLKADTDYSLTWSSSSTAVLTVSNGRLTAVKGGKSATVKARLVLKDASKQDLPAGSATKGINWFEDSVKVTTFATAPVDKIEIKAKKDPEPTGRPVAELGLNDLTADSFGGTAEQPVTQMVYTLTATASAGGKEQPSAVLKWTASNTAVAKVKANADSTVTLTVFNKPGTSRITATASKDGGFAESFLVTVKDSTPRLEESSVVMNSLLNAPAAAVHIYSSDGYDVQASSVKVMEKTGTETRESTIFQIAAGSANTYTLTPKTPGTAPAAGKYKLELQVPVTGVDTPYLLPLTVQVKAVKPKVTVSQTADDALDLYEKEGTGKLHISADAAIAEIKFKTSATVSTNPCLFRDDATQVSGSTGTLVYKVLSADASNYAKTYAKGTLTVTFTGYKPDAAYTKILTLKTNKKLPAFTATAADSTLYPEIGTANSTTVTFAEKTGAPLGAGTVRVLTKPAGLTVTPASPSAVTMDKTAKASSTIKYGVHRSSWYDNIEASVTCKIKKGKTPVLAFTNSTVIVNKNCLDRGPVTVGISVKENTSKPVSGALEVTGKNTAAKNVRSALSFTISEAGKLQVGITDTSRFTKAGTYTFTVKATGHELQPEGTLKVTVATKAPTVKYSQSGSIDLLDRATTQVVCKPKLTNITDALATTQPFTLSGLGADKFTVTEENGSAVIRAKPGVVLNQKTTYKPFLHVKLASGVQLSSQIKLTPKQTNPKLTVTPAKLQMFETVAEVSQTVTVTPQAFKSGKTAVIKDIKLTNYDDAFTYTYSSSGSGTLQVRGDAALKVNKSYKLKLAVTFENSAGNAAPVTAAVTVNYKK